MKKNPILMKVAKGSAMQMNYGSPAKKINLKKLGKKVVDKVKSRVKDKFTEVKKKATDFRDFFNTDEE
tara:strand:- start:76 stop:279 length:204 start_codon:yes stop_codon:yes gene_type:complete